MAIIQDLSKHQIYIIERFIIIIKTRLKIKRNLQNEVVFLKLITYKIVERIKNSHLETIVSQNEYKIYMDLIDVCVEEFEKLPTKITLKSLNDISITDIDGSKYEVLSKLL